MKKIVGILFLSSLLLSNVGNLVVYANTNTELEAKSDSSIAVESLEGQPLEEPILIEENIETATYEKSEEPILPEESTENNDVEESDTNFNNDIKIEDYTEEGQVDNFESTKQTRYIYDNGPTIILESISTSPKKVQPGDEVNISMEIIDPLNIKYIRISFKDANGAILKTELKYSEKTKKFEGKIVIKDYIRNGEMYLYEIEAMNKSNSNRTLIYSNKITDENFWREDFSNHSVEVSGSHGPELISDSISVTKSLDYEHRLQVNFTIKNFKYIDRFLRIGFIGPKEDNSIYQNVEYFNITRDSYGNYKGSYTLDDKFEEGEWNLKDIQSQLVDDYGDWIGQLSFGVPEDSKFDLSKIINYKSYIDPTSITINKKQIEPGEFIEFSIKPNNYEEIINQIDIVLANENGRVNGQNITLSYNEEQKKYIGQLTIPREYTVGSYYIDSIVQSASDDTTRIYNGSIYSESIINLSKGNFSVIKSTLPLISYTTHVQSYGWQNPVTSGKMSGTQGQSKRLEGIKISLGSLFSESIQYRTHVQSNGWMDWVGEGEISGTEGESKRLEAIQIKLTGKEATQYDIYYRVHAEKNGWLGWAKNGEEAGTEGFGRRLEAIEIVVVKKGATAPGTTTNAFVKKEIIPTVSYTTHVQSIGWQSWTKNGKMAGTSGKAKRLEGIKIKLGDLPYVGGVQYKTHVQSYGWQGWSTNGDLSGTSGKAKRLEAIQIQLTGEMSKKYDIYYRVHAQSYGWLGWAKNGESSGTEGKSKRLEGIEIKLVKKGEKAPSSNVKSFIK